MGSILACCACQALSCCLSATASAAEKAAGKSMCARFTYAVLLVIVAVLSYFLGKLPALFQNSWISTFWPAFATCPEEICYGAMSAYRITAASALFHFILSLVMIGVGSKGDCRVSLQNEWWFIKVPLLILIAVAFFFVPNSIFMYYGYVAIVGATLFIFIQLVLLVDFAHSWNESWVARFQESDNKSWLGALLASSLTLYIISIIGTTLMFIFYSPNVKGCGINSAFITVNLILCFAFSIFSIHPKLQEKNPRSGLLQSAVVTSFCTYLIYSAIASEPSSMGCSAIPFAKEGSYLSIILGVAFTFIAVIYSALRTSTSNIQGEKSPLVDSPQKEDTELSNEATEEEEAEHDEAPTYNFSFFHVTFCLASLYLCMVLTNWGIAVNTDTANDGISVDHGIAAVWVKVGSSWITIGLYVWSLIAPVILVGREF